MNRHIINEVIRRAESLSKKSMAAVAPYSILSGDLLGIDNIAWKVKEANADVEYVAVTDSRMKIVAHTDIKRIGELFEQPFSDTIKQTGGGTRVYEVKNRPDIFEIHTPMVFGSKQLGNVIVGINKSVLLF